MVALGGRKGMVQPFFLLALGAALHSCHASIGFFAIGGLPTSSSTQYYNRPAYYSVTDDEWSYNLSWSLPLGRRLPAATNVNGGPWEDPRSCGVIGQLQLAHSSRPAQASPLSLAVGMTTPCWASALWFVRTAPPSRGPISRSRATRTDSSTHTASAATLRYWRMQGQRLQLGTRSS
jgi:hypothetical protein